MSNVGRVKRSQPKRNAPIRSAAAQTDAAVSSLGEDTPLDEAVVDAIGHAVRLGYQVLAENLEEGRAAAKQFRVGQYGLSDVPSDLNQLATRMVRLARDLSSTTFDLADRVLQDPSLAAAISRLTAEPAAAKPKKSASTKTADQGPTRTSTPTASAPSPVVPISCAFSGAGTATLLTSWLMRPPSPTTLTTPGLSTLGGNAPDITDVKIAATADGLGTLASIAIPKGQPAGIYSGAIVTADTQIAVGTLTIQVGA